MTPCSWCPGSIRPPSPPKPPAGDRPPRWRSDFTARASRTRSGRNSTTPHSGRSPTRRPPIPTRRRPRRSAPGRPLLLAGRHAVRPARSHRISHHLRGSGRVGDGRGADSHDRGDASERPGPVDPDADDHRPRRRGREHLSGRSLGPPTPAPVTPLQKRRGRRVDLRHPGAHPRGISTSVMRSGFPAARGAWRRGSPSREPTRPCRFRPRK